MTQLLVQADDIAITPAVTLGILQSIEQGIVRSTGLFTNQPNAAFAATKLRELDGVDIGIDLNFVTGRPVLNPADIPNLVTSDGRFRTSHEIRAQYPAAGGDPIYPEFLEEPFPEEEVAAEAQAQIDRFIDIMGRLPAYIHHHSLVSAATDRVFHELAQEHGLLPVDDLLRHGPAHVLPNPWYARPFGLEEQAQSDPIAALTALMPRIVEHELSILVTHPGLVDAELFALSSYSVVRARDLEMTTSPVVRDMLERAQVELVSYTSAKLGGRPLREVLADGHPTSTPPPSA